MPGKGLLTGQGFRQAIAGPLLPKHCPRRRPGIFRLFHALVNLEIWIQLPFATVDKSGISYLT